MNRFLALIRNLTTPTDFSILYPVGNTKLELIYQSGSPVSGTLAKTNNNDTLAASGTTTVTGSLARTNNNDTLAASGTTTVVGTLARTNANDTSAASGTTTVIGSLAHTNANDTLAASGTTPVVGSLAVTNNNDTLAASGDAGAAPPVTAPVSIPGGGRRGPYQSLPEPLTVRDILLREDEELMAVF